MKTKWIPFVPPEVDTIYDPPLKVRRGKEPICLELVMYSPRAHYCYLTKEDAHAKSVPFEIEAPEEQQRMTWLQLMQLCSSGNWFFVEQQGFISHRCTVDICDADTVVDPKVKVARFSKNITHTDQLEWIEPTTDLLDDL